MSENERVYLTGYSGFLGKEVLKLFLKERFDIILLGRKPSSAANFKKIDLEKGEGLGEAFSDGSGVLVHLAAKIPKGAPEDYRKTNLQGTISLVESAKKAGVKKIIFASTWDVYGYHQEKTEIDEGCTPNPENQYAESKLETEEYLLKESEDSSISLKILRFGNLYGPAPSQAGALMNFISNISNNSEIKISGDGSQERDYLYVTDAAKAVLLSMESKSERTIFNIGSGVPTSIKQLAEITSQAYKRFGIEGKGTKFEGEASSLSRYLNIGTAKSELGYRPETDIRTGIAKTIVWYEKNVRKRTPRAIVFDVDGTIFNIRKRYEDAMLHSLEKHGISDVGNKRSVIIPMRREGKSGKQIIMELAGVDEKKAQEIDAKRKELIETEEYLNMDVISDGTKEVLGKLGSYKLGAITFRKRLAEDLEGFGIKDHFDILMAIDKSKTKRKEDALIKAAKKLGVSTFELIVVGDTEDDIHAGNNVGAKTIGISTGLSSSEQLKRFGADETIDSLAELLD